MNVINRLILLILVCKLFTACAPPSNQQTGADTTDSTAVDSAGTLVEGQDGQTGDGCIIDKEKFQKVKVFADLSEELDKNRVPKQASLLAFAPRRMNQGDQGSCVGWSSAYAARTILESSAKQVDPNKLNFSPAFIYNQIKVRDCQSGSYINDALDVMRQQGALPMDKFPYNANDCERKPSSTLKEKANDFKIEGYTRLTKNTGFDINYAAMKQSLAQKGPIVIAMPVGGSFERLMGKRLWVPTAQDKGMLNRFKSGDFQGSGLGGHAMCLIGYDEDKGTVEVMNSWGDKWGGQGIFEMPIRDFMEWCMEAYAVHPLRTAVVEEQAFEFEVALGLFQTNTKKYLPLAPEKNYTVTAQARPGTRFKIEVDNSMPCYLYVIGQEMNGSCYRLFPYTPLHSAYAGLSGGRLFPSDQTLFLDAKGKEDNFAILVSKTEQDIDKLVSSISASSGSNLEDKIKGALGSALIPIQDVNFKPEQLVKVQVKKTKGDIVPLVIRIKK
jgi:hypothetical protein